MPGGFRRSYIDLWHRENLEIPQVEAEIASKGFRTIANL